jgi:gas vesicle protein
MLDSMLEAGNQEKIFTPLIGRGVRFIVRGKSADTIFSEIKQNLDELESNKKRFEEVKKLFDITNNVVDSGDFSKEDIKSIKSSIEEMKNMEDSQLQARAKQLAKKIREYSDNNNK